MVKFSSTLIADSRAWLLNNIHSTLNTIISQRNKLPNLVTRNIYTLLIVLGLTFVFTKSIA